MENNEIYPKGTKQEGEDFALRQKIKKIVGEEVESIVKEETYKAFKKLGYKEKDGYMYIIASGEDNKEKEVGKGAAEGKINITISKPKMLNMGAVKPVSYMQKTTTFGGKRIISEIYLEIIDENVNISYKNTEASGFHQSSNKDTYAPRKLEKNATIVGVKDTKSFKNKLKEFFAEIAEAEAKYLTGTKIGNSDKIQKDMNDSIVKESKYNMKLTDLLSSSFEEAAKKIDNFVNESLKVDEKKAKPHCEPCDDKLLVGEKEIEDEEEEKIDEITTSGAGIGGPTQPSGFKYAAPGWAADGKTPDLKSSKSLGYTPVEMSEAVRNTTYGQMRTERPYLLRESNGSYKFMAPYTEAVPMNQGKNWPPKGMEKNHTMGDMLDADVNSKEELGKTGHGELNKVDEYKDKINLSKRKFVSLKENEEKGINKRYIITETFTKEEQSRRWKELCETDCFCDIKDTKDTYTAKDYNDEASKEFENNNKPLESDLSNTQFSGEEEGFIDVPKVKGSMVVFRLSESDVKKNKTYIMDHFTNKLVLNPLFKARD